MNSTRHPRYHRLMYADGDSTRTGDPTTYFSTLAGGYNVHRPSYPIEAVDAIVNAARSALKDPTPLIADIGCGTGISTRLLASRGARVVGIDPNPGMLAEAQRQSTGDSVTFVVGRAEATTLATGALDAVLCAQAFHWFDQPAALREFHRVLKPHGILALLWNVQDETDAMTAAYAEVCRRAQTIAARAGLVVPTERGAVLDSSRAFHHVRMLVFTNEQELDLRGLLGRAASASYFPREDPERSTLQQVLQNAFAEYERAGVVRLRYRVELTLADRAPQHS